MIWKKWTYREKNKSLFVFALVMLVLCWLLAFRKTYRLISEYNELKKGIVSNRTSLHEKDGVLRKAASQEHLIQRYTRDSTAWVTNFLNEVGLQLCQLPVEARYENKKVGNGHHTVEREIMLSGSLSALLEALQSLEQSFYVNSVRIYVEKDELRCTARLAMIKKR